ncbi:MAG: hypothetical protein ACLSAH_12475 [Bilophila wadsworthia]
MAVSVRKPVLYAFGVVLCAGIIGGIWLWYRTHCVLITNDSRIEGTLVGVASRLSDRVVQVMVNEGDTVHKGQGSCASTAAASWPAKPRPRPRLSLPPVGGRQGRVPAAGDHGGAGPSGSGAGHAGAGGRDFRRMEQLARNDGGVTQADRDAASSAYRAAQANVAAAQEGAAGRLAPESSGPPKHRSCRRRPNSTRSTCCARTA